MIVRATRREALRHGAAAAAAAALPSPALAEEAWPGKPIRIICGYPAGGLTDIFARAYGEHIAQRTGQPVFVENKAGASGAIAAEQVKSAPPDGYTLMWTISTTMIMNKVLFKKLPYDPDKDFVLISWMDAGHLPTIVNKDVPAKNLKEFVAYAKENQAKMQFGSAGAGSATHLGCVVLNTAMGTNITHVPYKGTGPAMQDLVAGRIDFLCEIITTAKPQIEGGNVRALAIMTTERSAVMPKLPTSREQGLDVQAYTWNAFYAPKGTPDAVVKKLNDAMVAAMTTPAVHDRLQGLGAMIVTKERSTPAYLGKFTADEIKKWAVPIKASGVSIE